MTLVHPGGLRPATTSPVVSLWLHARSNRTVGQGDEADRMDPYQLLAQHSDITLIRERLPDGQVGRWYPAIRVIMLDDRLSRAEERCTLLHELIHVLADDVYLGDRRLNGLQERRCHEMVARALIPLDRLAAEAMWAADDHQLAEALDVDLDTLRVRQTSLTKTERLSIASYYDDVEETA